jgi:hypothetical protein
MLVPWETLIKGAHEADPLIDALQGVMCEIETKVLGKKAFQAAKILLIDMLENR